jgi:hypothetical protein
LLFLPGLLTTLALGRLFGVATFTIRFSLRSRSSLSRCAMRLDGSFKRGTRHAKLGGAVVDPQLPFAGRQARQTLGFETSTPNNLLGRDFRLREADNFRIIAHRIGLLSGPRARCYAH